MLRNLLSITGMLLIALSMTGPVAAQEKMARVRFLHAAIDVGPVDVLVDGKSVVSKVGFADVSKYFEVPSGVRKLTFMIPGQDTATAINADVTFEPDRAYTVAAGKQAEMSINIFNDDLSTPPAGKARLRLSHLSPDAPAVDAEIVNGPTLFEGIGFGKSSAYELVDAGTYNLRVVAAGESTVFLQLPNTQLQAGKTYDIFAVGRLATLWAQIAEVTPSQVGAVAVATSATPPAQMPVTADDGPGASAPWLLVVGSLLAVAGSALRLRAVQHVIHGGTPIPRRRRISARRD